MNLGDIQTKVTELTNASSGTSGLYPDANRLINLNLWYNKIHTMILQSQDEWDYDDNNITDFPILTTNLVAGQQDYSLPSNIINIKRLEISYDGSQWYKVEPFDINERGRDTNNLSDFVKNKPFYDILGNSLFLYPIPDANVSAGLKIWIDRDITEFTLPDLQNGIKTPGFDNQFHAMLADGVAYEFASANGQPTANALAVKLQDWEVRLKKHYGMKQKDRNINLKASFISYE